MNKTYFLRLFVVIFLLSLGGQSFSQDNKYSVYYYRRASLFEKLRVNSNDIVFLGNSITDGAEWNELFDHPNIKNRGISGDITQGILDRLNPIVSGKPAKLFLMIGINDMSRSIGQDTIVDNIAKIIDEFQTKSPDTKIYLQSILPVNDNFTNYKKHAACQKQVPEINKELKKLAAKRKITYIDLFPHFTNETGIQLNEKYTNDGLHLMGDGYLVWVDLIKDYVNE
ncbi:GDSL-type esterase/lipase family protein [Maribellus sp. YY47]|uniref:GDSL-type esterase/lipase family protein n=1 Tax=Maribellus sp. YY47 TaxID=2929486 RepID=UPI00200128C2|nr:GDSL-type esterase/lipase family protein [Maribellus sp. YY47]MCK3684728.1 GDSL-type esterase/lipase family protein [Maribellus sp. YY47]